MLGTHHHGAELVDHEGPSPGAHAALAEEDRARRGGLDQDGHDRHRRHRGEQQPRRDGDVESPLQQALAAREAMPAQREEGHAVDGFHDDARGSEIRQPRRHPDRDLGVRERRVEGLQGAGSDRAACHHDAADPVRSDDCPDVIDGAHDGETVDRRLTRVADVDKSGDIETHPGTAP